MAQTASKLFKTNGGGVCESNAPATGLAYRTTVLKITWSVLIRYENSLL